jgi:pilus assembly protein CpaE
MADSAVKCTIITADVALLGKAAHLIADSQRGLHMLAQITQPTPEIGKVQAEEIRRSGAQIILLDLGDDPSIGLRLARYLSEDQSGRVFILTGPTVAPEVLLEAMRVGASEYLPRPVEEADLAAALTRAARRISGAEAHEASHHGTILATFGAKGGVGVSTVASNIAVSLAKAGDATILVDLDLDMGSSAVMLGLRPRYSVLDVIRNLHRLDRDLLDSLVETHDSGLSVLASPSNVTPESVTREQARNMLQYLRRQYKYVVVDLDRSIVPATIGALETVDKALIVTTPDVASLNNTKRALPAVERAVGNRNRVQVLVNRRRGNDIITLSDIAKALGQDSVSSLPNDEEALLDSLNTGKPEVLRRKSKYGRELESLLATMISMNGTNGNSKHSGGAGLLGKFRRRRT